MTDIVWMKMNLTHKNLKRGPKLKLKNRDLFIQAGAKMFHETGYYASSINDIVQEAQLPKGSFYNYFESKEIFVNEVIDYYFNEALARMRNLFNNHDIAPLQRLQIFFEDSMKQLKDTGYIKGCLLGNLSSEIADHFPFVRGILSLHFQTWTELIAKCIDEAQQKGIIDNQLSSLLLAKFILNSWEGALIRMKVEKNDSSLQDFVRIVFKTILV